MRGLQNFISDIRSAQNKEQEQRRVEKELANIRQRFSDDKSLSGYDRRKYVWKLLYIYMLGYDIEFGHKQAADLIPLPKYKDKQVGYMACSLLLRENDEFLRLTMNAVRMDLTSRNEAFETLALSFIGNVGGSEMADALTQDVIKLLSSGAARPLLKKRASLALLRLIRKTSHDQQVVTADTFSPVINALLDERDLGLLLSATTLLQGVCARNGAAGYEGAVPRLVRILERLTTHREREVPAEYLYYGIPSPWLQCKCLRVLQFFPAPEVPSDQTSLTSILKSTIDAVGSGDAVKNANPNKGNALHAILFEAISVVLQHDVDHELLNVCISVLGKFLNSKDANIKYLALETLARLALVPEILDTIRVHQATVITSLRDVDLSIRKRSMDLLFTMCDASCAEELVREMLSYLVTSELGMREELVLKVAILAEKWAPSVQWYVDVALELLEKAGDYVSEDVWHRVVQLVTNNPAMQEYAARNVVEVLRRGATHESLICTSAYILGEFGRLIVNEVSPSEQFKLLNAVFPAASQPTKGLLMTAFVKIYLVDSANPELRTSVVGLFERHQRYMDAELQQRAVEYLRLVATPSAAAQHYLLPMPKWEERESTLLKRLQASEGVDPEAGRPAMRRSASNAHVSGNLSPVVSGAISPTKSMVGGTRLIVGTQIAQLPPQASVDLLGADSYKVAAGAPSNGVLAIMPANPVDLLSDLLSDTVTISPAQPQQPPPGAATPQYTGQPGQQYAGGFAVPYPGAPGQPASQYTGQPAPQYTGQPTPQYTGQPAPQYTGQPGQQYTGQPGQQYTGQPTPQYTGQPGQQYAGGFSAPYPGAPGQPAPQYTGQPAPQYTGQPAPQYTGQPAPQYAGGFAAQHTGGPAPQYTGGPPPPQNTGQTAYPAQPQQPAYPPLPTAGYPPASAVSPYMAQQAQAAAQLPLAPSYSSGSVPAPYGQPGAAPPGSAFAAQPAPLQDVAAAAVPGGPEGARLAGSIEGWFGSLLVKDRGILYEDQNLQIGVQSRYTRGTGQVVLFLGNKNADVALSGVALIVVQQQGLQVTAGNVPNALQPKQQVQVVISAAAIAPFSGAPSLVLGYQVAGVAVRQQLQLPIVPHKFFEPAPTIPKELFFEQWKALGAPPVKAQEMVERATPVATPTLVTLSRMVNLGVEHGYLDPSPHNEAGAAYFICGPQGAEQSILVMARIEGNPQNMAQFRVTVASPAPQLSTHVKDLLATHLRSIAA